MMFLITQVCIISTKRRYHILKQSKQARRIHLSVLDEAGTELDRKVGGPHRWIGRFGKMNVATVRGIERNASRVPPYVEFLGNHAALELFRPVYANGLPTGLPELQREKTQLQIQECFQSGLNMRLRRWFARAVKPGKIPAIIPHTISLLRRNTKKACTGERISICGAKLNG